MNISHPIAEEPNSRLAILSAMCLIIASATAFILPPVWAVIFLIIQEILILLTTFFVSSTWNWKERTVVILSTVTGIFAGFLTRYMTMNIPLISFG